MSKRPLSPVAQAAKAIRQSLKAQFPGQKFSVTSKSYSMGSSINVSWTDGPTQADVTAITAPYRNVRYCEHSQEILSGGNQFVFTRRSYSLATFVPTARHLCQHTTVWSDIDVDSLTFAESGDDAYLCNDPTIIENSTFYSLQEQVRKHLAATSFYVSPTPASSAPAPDPTAAPSSTVTITENPAKDGIEIRFSDKPTETTRQALKENGFRWSRSNSLWYAKRSAAALSFAQQLSQTLTTPPPPVLSLPAAPATPPPVQPGPAVEPSPQPEPSAPTYQVITQPPILTPIEFLTDRQRLQHQLDRLNLEQLPTAQVEALLAVLA